MPTIVDNSTLTLSRLFSAPTWCSSGQANEQTEDGLNPISSNVVPEGYERWAAKRKREFRCGRHHAHMALKMAGSAVTDVFRQSDSVPLFPPGFHGSITHTGRDDVFAAAVVCRDSVRVGLDAEKYRPLAEDLISYILSPGERNKLANHCQADGVMTEGELAVLAFSAKEAFYKCSYPHHRTYIGFHDVEFGLDTAPVIDTVGEFRIDVLRKDIPSLPRLFHGRYEQYGEYLVCGVQWAVETA